MQHGTTDHSDRLQKSYQVYFLIFSRDGAS
jgi:hypothetical protein